MICIVEVLIYICTHTCEPVCSCIFVWIHNNGLHCKYKAVLLASEIATWQERGTLQTESLLVPIPKQSNIHHDEWGLQTWNNTQGHISHVCYTHLCRAQWPGLCNHPTVCYEMKTPLPVFYSSPGPGTFDWTPAQCCWCSCCLYPNNCSPASKWSILEDCFCLCEDHACLLSFPGISCQMTSLSATHVRITITKVFTPIPAIFQIKCSSPNSRSVSTAITYSTGLHQSLSFS